MKVTRKFLKTQTPFVKNLLKVAKQEISGLSDVWALIRNRVSFSNKVETKRPYFQGQYKVFVKEPIKYKHQEFQFPLLDAAHCGTESEHQVSNGSLIGLFSLFILSPFTRILELRTK